MDRCGTTLQPLKAHPAARFICCSPLKMATPSLLSISGRARAPKSKQAQLAGSITCPLPTPPSSQQNSTESPTSATDNQTQKTESISSDDPVPPSSDIFTPAIPKFDLEKTFPSIFAAVGLMRPLRGSRDADSMRSLAQVFSTCLQTIIHSMDHLPYDVRLNSEYEFAQYAVVFTGGLFSGQVAKMDAERRPGQVSEGIDIALELVDMTIASLRHFLGVAERIVADHKPLPALPTNAIPDLDLVSDQSDTKDPLPLTSIAAQVLSSADFVFVDMPPPSADTESQLSIDKRVRRGRRGSLIRRIVGGANASSKASLFSARTKSSLTLVNLDAPSLADSKAASVQESFHSEEKERPPDIEYVLRHSNVFFPADPYFPEVDVDMPLPTGETASVRLDHEGQLKGATLPALIRVLTSKEGVLDPNFTTVFFTCFRYFSTPQEVFEQLAKRFDEEPEVSLTPAQLRVWTREAMHVRIRVGKALVLWVKQYWRPRFDRVVLEPLQAFALSRVVVELPEKLATDILKGLNQVAGASSEEDCFRTRNARELQLVNSLPDPVPTGFKIPADHSGDLVSQVLRYDNSAGREELARQLTLKISGLFSQLNPEDAVVFWRTGQDYMVKKKIEAVISLERSIYLWVIYTILQPLTREERIRMMVFWLDTAANCVRLRNFGVASAIFSGVAASPISRMKVTVLQVPVRSKQIYANLETYFDGTQNLTVYRDALAESHLPAIPMLAPLIHDILAVDMVPGAIDSTVGSDDRKLVNLQGYRVILKTVHAMESCLVPYKFAKSDEFQGWLDNVLADFHPRLEAALTEGYYTKSCEIEPKEPQLSGMQSTWLYTGSAKPDKGYTLHPIPRSQKQSLSTLLGLRKMN